MTTSGRWLRARWLPLVAGLLAAAPVIVSTVRAVADSWTPYGDRAVIAARSFDVLSTHPPLVGQYTQWSQILGRPIFSPGPMLYWLLAIPAHLGSTALPIWMAVVNVLCILVTVLLARRRGGDVLMFATAIAIPLMCRSLLSETFHDIWNPSTTPLPFTVLCFAAWSVACGEYRLLPLTVLLVSFLIQTHLTFLAPSLGLLVVAVIGLVLVRRSRPAPPSDAAPSDGGSLRPWVWASGVIVVLCWIAPLVNQLFESGNLRLIAKAVLTARGSLGLNAGWHSIVNALGVAPWWLRHPISDPRRLVEVVTAPGWGAQVSCVILLLVLIGGLVAGLVRRQAATASVAAIALVLALAMGAGTASTPTSHLLALTVGYTLWWAAPAGMFVWLTAGWLVVRLAPTFGFRPGFGSRPAGLARRWPAVALALTALLALLIGFRQPLDSDRGEYKPFASVARSLARALPHSDTALVSADPTLQGLELGYTVVYALQRQGATPLVGPDLAGYLGSHYVVGDRHYNDRIELVFNHPPPSGFRVIARVRVRPPSPVSVGVFTVALGPGR
ncbi:MAG TPA: hypothetical protein VGL51_13075 [Solirubrobacteraceae bacterium]